MLFAAMDPEISWNEAEGNPLAVRNAYVGLQAVGDGVFARLLSAIDNFTAVPSRFIDGGDHVVVLGRYGGTMKRDRAPLDAPFCHVYRFDSDKAVMFQQYTDTAQWTRSITSPRAHEIPNVKSVYSSDNWRVLTEPMDSNLFSAGHLDAVNRHAAVVR